MEMFWVSRMMNFRVALSTFISADALFTLRDCFTPFEDTDKQKV